MKRKRLQLLLALLLTAVTGAWADELTVYDGTSYDNYSPANICYIEQYTRSQTVIPSTALTAMKGCDITAMKFYSNSIAASGPIDYSFDVYLKEVSYTAFAESSPTFEPKSSCTSVHQGKLSISNYELTITFSKPFHYNGGNLLLGMENTSKVMYYYITFLGRDTGSSLSNISIHHKTDLSLATSIAKSSFIPKTTFTYVVPTYSVKLADGTQDAANWTIASGENSATGDAADGLTGLKEGDAVTLTYGGRLKVKGVTATTDAEPDPLATPLTIEAITPGTIVVNIDGTLTSGMKYSTDGGTTKTPITLTTGITVAKGDKVQFYGNGTDIQAYYIQNVVNVSINGSGNGFQTKVYGNIMSLLDETGFATKTELPNNDYVFSGLFNTNLTLSDASELLLPATELTPYCYAYMFEGCTNLTTAPKLPATTLATRCYESMFMNCTSLTTAPKLPATTLASKCYRGMFFLCSSLTTAYVKAAFTAVNDVCALMFDGCSAGAVLHTTPDNKASWEAKMGTGKTWPKWSVADDWQD